MANPTNEKTFTLTLTEPDLNILQTALGEIPHKFAHPLLAKMAGQIQDQTIANLNKAAAKKAAAEKKAAEAKAVAAKPAPAPKSDKPAAPGQPIDDTDTD